ncbi:IclR family transcriptional regulator [Natrarchaeobius sp. A-rgal3]|uniref:IclR family transcriptional regulator n=1 Tax=Natrarchaeobius versutus TaxID=1679078 RepID=UPI0035101995
MPGDEDGNTIKSTETLLVLIQTIQRRGTVGITELANEADVSKSTVHRHLSTLEKHGYVIKADRQYRLGFRFLDIGINVRNQFEVYRRMKQTVFRLAIETNELVSFVVEENGWGVFLYRLQGEQGVSSSAHVGKHSYLHHTSAGKALLAHLPEERIHDILDERGLPPKTNETITSREDLLAELETIKDQRVAFSIGEHTAGLSSVGAPVVSPDGDVLGGLSVAGPTHRMAGERFEEEIPEQLLSIINEFELNVTYS